MLGIHDMGGMHNFGPIDPVDDQVFHHEWEGLTFALEKICGHYGVWHGADEVRHAIEKIGHGAYLTSTYYEHWLHAWEPLLFDKGIVGEGELRARQQDIRDGRPLPDEFPDSTPAEIDELSQALRRMISQGFKATRVIDDAATFSIGDKVCVLPKPVATHTRCPRYVWDREGVITLHHGAHILPDVAASGDGKEFAEHLYSVTFQGSTLWGSESEPGTTFTVDLWESYLTAAADRTDPQTHERNS